MNNDKQDLKAAIEQVLRMIEAKPVMSVEDHVIAQYIRFVLKDNRS